MLAFTLLLAPLLGSAQQEEPTFSFFSEWSFAPAQWKGWTDFGEKNAKPVFEKMMANGTIIGWGMYTTAVHDRSAITHGWWYEATSITAIEKVRAELDKLPPNPIADAALKRRDSLVRCSIHRSNAASGSDGYLWADAVLVQPGKMGEWRELWEKYNKPHFDELIANGTLVAYWVQVEQMHTENPYLVYVLCVTPGAEALKKVLALSPDHAERGPQENKAIAEAFAAVTVAGAHRDYLAGVTHYAQK